MPHMKRSASPDPTLVDHENNSGAEPPKVTPVPRPSAQSMHESVAVWDGCGSCGAEPYWIEIGSQKGLSNGRGNVHGG
ncbi:hypothetical protein Thi970DRAFT_04561 [Thiorhodovibrio frisius]|uniref:Uncharacterized protein n=1 Tax=Thiorhodovibrio frisius TaxID=631362 RepID=H8Z7G1_9GAMM|nr:hypothetical protein Thi970DRAFT_04561 [Thiorhodovibrio frisius]WPL21947.1 hypothetical protein Thiofri_02087 [Thiorhodovibrio frisius]